MRECSDWSNVAHLLAARRGVDVDSQLYHLPNAFCGELKADALHIV
jgi:hypothetical protein